MKIDLRDKKTLDRREKIMKGFTTVPVILLFTVLLVGCSVNMATYRTPNGYKVHWEAYRPAKPSILIEHYGGWSNIGYTDPERPARPFTLLKRDTNLRVYPGHPRNFPGYVSRVLVWCDNQGPIPARKNGSGYNFSLSSRGKWLQGINPEFSGLSPGIHMITAEIVWTTSKGPYYRGPDEADLVIPVYCQVEIDPYYIED